MMSLYHQLEKQRLLSLSEPITNPVELPLTAVSSLYGPGNVIAWVLVTMCVVWDSYARHISRQAKLISSKVETKCGDPGKLAVLDPNVVGAIVYPLVASADALYRLHSARGSAPTLEDLSGLLAPAKVCQYGATLILFCLFASVSVDAANALPGTFDEANIYLAGVEYIPMKRNTPRNAALFITAVWLNIIGLLTPCQTAFYSPVRSAAELQGLAIVDAKRAHANFEYANEVSIPNIPRSQLLCPISVGGVYVWVAIGAMVVTLTWRLPPLRSQPTIMYTRRERGSLAAVLLRNSAMYILGIATAANLTIGVVGIIVEVLGGRFLPRVGGVKITDLDQAVTLSLGIFSWLYSIYCCNIERRKLKYEASN